jgi:hypothetical protein
MDARNYVHREIKSALSNKVEIFSFEARLRSD